MTASEGLIDQPEHRAIDHSAAKPRFGNELLSRLSADDHARLADSLRPVSIMAGQRLNDDSTKAPLLYFLSSGAAAIVVGFGDRALAVGLIGRESLVHPTLALGLAATDITVKVLFDGQAQCIQQACFLKVAASSPTLQRFCILCREAIAMQSHTLALARTLRAEQRLAQWLLMCHDRVRRDDLVLTHDSLALLMAIRRPTITTALQMLEERKLISAKRGVVRVIDRAGLEHHTDSLYGRTEREHERLLHGG